MRVCGQILFSNSKFIGGKMGDSGDNNNAAIGIAVLAFCIMDVSINALQVRSDDRSDNGTSVTG